MSGEPLAIFFFKTYFWICNSMVVFPGPGRAYFSLKSHLKFDEIEKVKHCRFFLSILPMARSNVATEMMKAFCMICVFS